MTLINHGKPTTAGANRLAPASSTSHGGTCEFQGMLTSYCPSIYLLQVLSTKSFLLCFITQILRLQEGFTLLST